MQFRRRDARLFAVGGHEIRCLPVGEQKLEQGLRRDLEGSDGESDGGSEKVEVFEERSSWGVGEKEGDEEKDACSSQKESKRRGVWSSEGGREGVSESFEPVEGKVMRLT